MKNKFIYLSLIIILAAVLRFINLDLLSLFGDEVDVGYQAYSLLKTGKDYMGQTLPLYIHSLAEWRAPLYIYASIPAIALFGLNEFGVRFTPALFGVLGVFLMYLLGRSLKDEKFGLISALVLTVLPWHIHYSRAAFEVTLLIDLLLAGTILLLNAKNKWHLFSAGVLFALTPFTYSTAAIFTPLYVLIIFFLTHKTVNIRKKWFIFPFAIIFFIFVYNSMFGQANARFSLISVFNSEQILDTTNIERTETGLENERFFHNKIVGWGEEIASNYVKSFSPEFLFVGGDPLPRHSVPSTGVILWGLSIPLAFGLFVLFSTKDKGKWFIISWLLLAPISSALTQGGGNHATRLFLMVVPISFIIALGFEHLFKFRKIIAFVAVLLTLGSLIFYLHRYTAHYPLQTWKYWHYGYKQTMQKVGEVQEDYYSVYINNTYEPSLLHFLFWTKYDPKDFQEKFNGDAPKDYPDGFNGFFFDNALFGEDKNGFGEFMTPGHLYMFAQGKEIPGDWDWGTSAPSEISVIEVVRDPQGKPLFTIATKKSTSE